MKKAGRLIVPFFKTGLKCAIVFIILLHGYSSFGQSCTGSIIVDAPSTPVIDGIIDPAWSKAPATPITKTIVGNGTLQSDYSATWKAMYDNNFLYVLVEVKDATLTHDGGNPWDNDAVEIYIDGAHNGGTTYDANDFQLGFQLQFPTLQPTMYGFGSTAGVTSKMPDVPGGYLLEMAIPWSTIGGTATNGRQIGFDVNINDDDNGGSRDGTSGWYGTSNQLFSNPSFFGTVALTQCSDPLSLTGAHTDPNCGSSADGTINLTGADGTGPYTYSINGTNFFSSGSFTGLNAGTYNVSVKDAASKRVDSTIILETAGSTLIVKNDTAVCPGSSVILSVSGGSNYTWTASPADPTLTAINSATPTVTPAVTTTYTVSSPTIGSNLIANANFQSGNVGFTTDYTYTTSSTFTAQTYSISANPELQNSFFTPCGDHTTGTGKMMVIDGGLSATAKVWRQVVPVIANSNYVFSYWIQTVADNPTTGDDHPGNLDTKINGTSIGIGVSPVMGLPCGNWVQKTFTWNSGAATSADIIIYDLTISAGGNDLAIDDIFFSTGCVASKTITVTVDAPLAPSTTPIQPTCTSATGSIKVTSVETGATYSFNNGGAFQASPTSSALAGGATYQVKIKNALGCVSPATPVTLISQPATPAAPAVTPTQPTCSSATGTIEVTSVATGLTYSFDNGVTFQASPISPTLPANATYQVKVQNATGCISPATSVTLNAQPGAVAAPSATPTQPTCAVSTGAIEVTSTATGLSYSFDNGGTYQASAISPALPANATYQVKVKNAAGCTSPATPITLNAQPLTPSAPSATPTHPTCTVSTGTIEVTSVAAGSTYSFDNGVTFQASAISNALAGGTTYQVKVKNAASCISLATPVTINIQPSTPLAPSATPTQPTCAVSTGAIEVTSTATGLTYSFDNGGSYQASAISNALPGNATYQVKVKNAAGCISPATTITLNAQPGAVAAPSATPTHPTCTVSTGTIEVTSIAAGSTYSFDNGVSFQSSAISNALAGGATYQVKVKNAAGCISPATPVTLNVQPSTSVAPSATPTHPTCVLSTGTIEVTSTAIGLSYSFDNGVSFQSSAISNALAGNAIYQVKTKNTAGCISAATPITINAQPLTPLTPSVTPTHPSCTVSTGTLEVTSTATGLTYSFDNGGSYQSSPTSNVLTGNATYQVKVKNAAGCISPATSVTLNAQPGALLAPSATPTHSTCLVSTGVIEVTSAAAGLSYSFDNGGSYQSSATSNALAGGTTYQVKVKNAAGCVSPATAVTLNAQPLTPSAPTVIPTHPTCQIATGTIEITSTVAGSTYSFDNGGSFQSSAISGPLAGGITYQVKVKNSTGCISAATPVTLNAQPSTPSAPSATPTHPTCTIATGTIEVTSIAAGSTYSFDDGVTYQSSAISNALSGGATYLVKVKSAAGCISPATSIALNTQPAGPLAPTATPSQPTCTTQGSIEVMSTAVGSMYSFDNGGSYQTSAISNALAGGVTYQVKVKNAAGCISPATPITLNTQPATPSAPSAIPTQPSCTIATGMIEVTSIAAGSTYSFDDGVSFQPSATSSSLTGGATYQVKVKNTAGCISPATPISLNAQPVTPGAPSTNVEQPTCTTATGKISVIATTIGDTYSFDNGVSYQSSSVSLPLAAGNNYNVKVKTSAGCISPATLTSISASLASVDPPSTQPVVYCQNDNAVSLSGAVVGVNLQWYTAPAGGIGTTSAPTPVTTNAGTTSYFVTQSNGVCESQRASVTVTVNKIPVAYAGGPEVRLIEGQSTQLKSNATGNNITIKWTPDVAINSTSVERPVVKPLATTRYFMVVTDGGCIAYDTVDVIIVEQVFIPNIFSPNKDGIHDTWIIDKIDQYPTANVQVFNRYGQFIYGSTGYNRPWDGTCNGKPVPVGAYYYIIKLKDDEKPIGGSVSVIR